MVKVLRYLSLWLLLLATIPCMADSEEVIIFKDFKGFELGNYRPTTDSYYEVVLPYDSNNWGTTLLSPIIDLSDYHNVILSYEHGSYKAVRSNYSLYIREDGSEYWEYLKVPNSLTWTGNNIIRDVNNYSNSGDISLMYYDGKKVQIKIVGNDLSYKRLGFRNFKIRGKEGAPTITLTELDNVTEVDGLSDGTHVKLMLNNAEVTFGQSNLGFLKDGNVRYVISGYLGEFDYSSYYYYNGEVAAVYRNHLGLPVFYVYHSAVQRTYRDEYMDWESERYQPATIEADDFLNHLGEVVTVELYKNNIDIVNYYNYWSGHTTVYDPDQYPIRVKGIPFPSADGKKQIIIVDEVPTAVLYDDKSNVFLNESYISLEIRRALKKDSWNTIVLPVNRTLSSFGSNCQLAKYVSEDNGTLVFENATSIEAGVPYLIKPQSDIQNIYAYSVDIAPVEPVAVNNGEFSFVPTFMPVHPNGKSYYLASGNTIRPLASGGTINGFRAYFQPISSNAAQARAISIDGVVTAIDEIEIDGITNAPMYNLNGQRVNDSSKKGLYIQNGKKIIR